MLAITWINQRNKVGHPASSYSYRNHNARHIYSCTVNKKRLNKLYIWMTERRTTDHYYLKMNLGARSLGWNLLFEGTFSNVLFLFNPKEPGGEVGAESARDLYNCMQFFNNLSYWLPILWLCPKLIFLTTNLIFKLFEGQKLHLFNDILKVIRKFFYLYIFCLHSVFANLLNTRHI